MLDWIEAHPGLFWSVAAVSAAMFVGSLIAVPILVARIPADYFAHRHRHRTIGRDRHPVLFVALLVGKNALGVVLLLAGMAMLALPGQGLLTLLAALVLLDFPGKYAAERWLAGRRPVLRSLNWIRRKAGRPPLEVRRATRARS